MAGECSKSLNGGITVGQRREVYCPMDCIEVSHPWLSHLRDRRRPWPCALPRGDSKPPPPPPPLFGPASGVGTKEESRYFPHCTASQAHGNVSRPLTSIMGIAHPRPCHPDDVAKAESKLAQSCYLLHKAECIDEASHRCEKREALVQQRLPEFDESRVTNRDHALIPLIRTPSLFRGVLLGVVRALV